MTKTAGFTLIELMIVTYRSLILEVHFQELEV